MAREEVLLDVNINSKQAKKTLKELEKEQEEYAKKINKLESNIFLEREKLRDASTKAQKKASEKRIKSLQAEKTELSKIASDTTTEIDKLNKRFEETPSKFADALGDIGDSFGALAAPLSSARGGVLSLGKAFKSLLANPIVLLIAGIVSSVVALYKAFTRTTEGSNKMAVAFAYLEGLLIPLVKGAEDLANTLYDAFSNPQQALDSFSKAVQGFFDGFLNSVGLLGSAIKKLFNSDFDGAMEDAKKAFEPVVEVFEEATQAVEEYVEAADKMGKANAALVAGEKQLVNEQRQNTVSLAQQLKEREKLMNIRDNELLSIDERIAANEELNKIELKQATESERIAQKAVDLAAERIRLHGRTTENLDALANAESELANIQADSLGRQNEFILNRQTLKREEAEYARAVIDFELEKVNITEKSEEKKLKARIKALDDTAKLYGIDTIEYKEFLKQKELAELELSQYKKDLAAADALYYEELSKKQKEKDNEAKAENIESAKAEAVDLTNQVASAVFEATAANLQREKEQKLNAVKQTQNRETELIDAKLKRGLINEQQAAQAKEKIEKESAKKQEQIEREAFKKNQKMQTQQAIANGALAITNILATVPKFDFGVSTAILSAAAAASTALQVATIKSQKFAKGGILEGASHANGGIDMGNNQEAEGGEAIINKRSTAMFREELSMINQAGGGVKFARGGVLSGGSSSVEGGSTMTAQLQELIEISRQPTRAVVSETEITDSQNRINNIESRSSF